MRRQAGINIVLNALEAPIRQIAENSGVEGSIVVGRIRDNKSKTFGFNAQTEEYVRHAPGWDRRSGEGVAKPRSRMPAVVLESQANWIRVWKGFACGPNNRGCAR